MEDEAKSLSLFLSEFDHQVSQIVKIYSLLEEKSALFTSEEIGSEHVESTGYWLHNLYCALEDLFKIVAAHWENSLSHDGAFHTNLLKRMLIRIEGIRPNVISEESFHCLNELKGFRHVFRHAYNFGLDQERTAFLLRRVLMRKPVVLDDLKHFRGMVAALMSAD